MDIKKTLAEISSLEMEKARLEVEVRQIEERTQAAAKNMADLGVDSTTIYTEIEKLEKSIAERLAAAKGAARIVFQSDLLPMMIATGSKVEAWLE